MLTDHLPEGLFAILDENYSEGLLTSEIIESFLDSDAIPFIVRNKSLSREDYADYINEINFMKHEMDFEFIVHHDAQLALQTDAMGVHLTAQSQSVEAVRALFGHDRIIGYSAHSLEEALQAKRQGADYVFLGAIFETPKSDPNHPILGLEVLKQACRKIEIPVYAIGGVNAQNLAPVKDAGAAGFSALRAVYTNREIEHNISKLGFIWEDI